MKVEGGRSGAQGTLLSSVLAGGVQLLSVLLEANDTSLAICKSYKINLWLKEPEESVEVDRYFIISRPAPHLL